MSSPHSSIAVEPEEDIVLANPAAGEEKPSAKDSDEKPSINEEKPSAKHRFRSAATKVFMEKM